MNLWPLYQTRRKLLGVVHRMETRGITLSLKRLRREVESYTLQHEKAKAVCLRLAGNRITNLASTKQLQAVLYDHFSLPRIRATKTGYATDVNTLRELQEGLSPRSKSYHFISSLVKSRKASKAVDYLESYGLAAVPVTNGAIRKLYGPALNRIPPKRWDRWAVLFPSFNITGTATTRFSSSDPNAQNVGKQEEYNLRRVFGPLPGREWYALDYSNIELRIFAYESGDRSLIKAFEAGESVHLVVAKVLWPRELAKLGPEEFKKTDKYRWVKNGNFALIYGAFPSTADKTYHQKGAYRKIRKRFPGIDKFMASKHSEAQRLGCVTILGGYRLQVPRNKPHVAVNYFVQGSAGWALALAMIRVDQYLQALSDHHLIMAIHDELVFDFPRNGHPSNREIINTIKHLMQQSGNDIGIPTPVEAERITTNWAEGEGF